MSDFFNTHLDKFIPEPNSGCWIWIGATRPDGNSKAYGVLMTPRNRKGVRARRKQLPAHRVSYEAVNGKVASGIQICHHCDNTYCVNPDHLYAGDYATNQADKARRGRAYRPRGAKNPKAKLSVEDVAEIRRLYFGNGTGKRGNAGILAKRYGVTVTTIQSVAKGRSWANGNEKANAKTEGRRAEKPSQGAAT